MQDTLFLTEVVDDELCRAVVAPLVEYNSAQAGKSQHRPLSVLMKDQAGCVLGGLCGPTWYDWLLIQFLVVPAAMRGRGVGTGIMRMAEREVLQCGCHGSWLGTFEFQARGFYERIGCECFGELPNYRPGFSRLIMKKSARSGSGMTPDTPSLCFVAGEPLRSSRVCASRPTRSARPMKKIVVTLLYLLGSSAFAASPAAKQYPCEKETAALMSMSSSWSSMYSAIQVMPERCFDGYFAEGISDVLVRKMGQDWPGFIVLVEKHAADQRFFSLVLDSINQTLDPSDVARVKNLAAHACPANMSAKCRRILAKINAQFGG